MLALVPCKYLYISDGGACKNRTRIDGFGIRGPTIKRTPLNLVGALSVALNSSTFQADAFTGLA